MKLLKDIASSKFSLARIFWGYGVVGCIIIGCFALALAYLFKAIEFIMLGFLIRFIWLIFITSCTIAILRDKITFWAVIALIILILALLIHGAALVGIINYYASE